MSLKIYDTASRELRDFVPLKPGHASIYLCGATVQSIPHIGHVRSGVAFDILRRWLTAQGYDVAFVRNVTDIDDKILAKAEENNRPWWEWAATHEREFQWVYRQLGVLPPSIEPRATGHIPEMITYMQRILDNGHGYAADGNVYAQPTTIEGYGEISGQKIDELDQGESAGTGKRDPRDFTMWKAVKPGEPFWESPWGPGRPGWHIECSAMATKYLGPEFDIHAGGLDLQFPHHENENAQAHAAGDPFARYWMHNGWVTMAGEKMSKSLGNVLSVPNILAMVRPVELRYYLGSAHYRSKLDYSEQALKDAASAYQRIENFVNQAYEILGREDIEGSTVDLCTVELAEAWPQDFEDAMNNDVAIPQALAVLHDTVRAGNTALAHNDIPALYQRALEVLAMTEVLGLNPLSEQWMVQEAGTQGLETVLDGLITAEMARRDTARENKDWAEADRIRDTLEAQGIKIIDGSSGTQWELVRK